MSNAKSPELSGRDHYDAIYRGELDLEARWLEYGAADKVDSIELLLQRGGISPRSMLELGCGTGAVIAECRARRLASELTAVDYSSEAIGYLRSRFPDVQAITADITSPDSRLDQPHDVVVISHVLEHLEKPAEFLAAVSRNLKFSWLIAEVPLEDLPGSRLKNLFRDRLRNPAGHVGFYTEGSYRRLIENSGFEIVATRRYAPVMSAEAIDFVCRKDGVSRRRAMIRRATGRHLPLHLGKVWTQLWYSHCAVLCRRRAV